jgi:hypothetical protein
MTYKKLLEGCYTSKAQKLATEMAYLNGFETEVEQGDMEEVERVDTEAMGGAF